MKSKSVAVFQYCTSFIHIFFLIFYSCFCISFVCYTHITGYSFTSSVTIMHTARYILYQNSFSWQLGSSFCSLECSRTSVHHYFGCSNVMPLTTAIWTKTSWSITTARLVLSQQRYQLLQSLQLRIVYDMPLLYRLYSEAKA